MIFSGLFLTGEHHGRHPEYFVGYLDHRHLSATHCHRVEATIRGQFHFFVPKKVNCPLIVQSTYTPKQLSRMIGRGHYPAQGKETSQSIHSSFAVCKMTTDHIMVKIRGIYPVRTVIDTGIVYMVKAWTNDGVVISTCSALDQKMVISRAFYR